jgi:branched-chain amino acid transport system permease protein
MNMFWQQVVNAIWLGAVYSLFALGYTLIFGVLGILNLAHPSLYMWGAFIGLVCVTTLHLPIWLALPIAMLGSGLLGILLDRIAFKPLRARHAPHLATLISSIGASIVLINVAQGIFSAQVSRFPFDIFPVHVFNFGAVSVTLLQLTILGTAVIGGW